MSYEKTSSLNTNLLPSNFMQTALRACHFTFPNALSDVANN